MNTTQQDGLFARTPVGAGLTVGLMSFAHVHAMGLAQLLLSSGATVLASDPDAERGRARAAELGIDYVGDHDALVARGVDGVVITAENSEHRRLTELAAASGAAVLSEKPLALSIADGRAMVEACDRAEVTLMTAFPMRFSPQVQQVAALVHNGDLGEVVAISGTNPGSCPGGWFVDPAKSGGGSVIDHTVHVADLMCWLTGAEPVTVYCQTNQLITPEYGVETGGLVSVTFANGVFGTIDASWSRLPSYPTWGGVTLEVVGTEGMVSIDAFGGLAWSSQEGRNPSTRHLRYGPDTSAPLVTEFLTAIRERRPATPSGLDGLRSTAIALAAYRSAAAGDVVDVDL